MSTFDGSPLVVGRFDEKSHSFLNIVKASDRFRTHDAYGFDEPAVEELKMSWGAWRSSFRLPEAIGTGSISRPS